MHVQLERLGAFSTAERLGLLTLAEEFLVSDPAKVTSFSLLPLTGTLGESFLSHF